MNRYKLIKKIIKFIGYKWIQNYNTYINLYICIKFSIDTCMYTTMIHTMCIKRYNKISKLSI